MIDEMKNSIPKLLYRYRKFDEYGYYKDLLKRNILFFSSPKKFNDPFDCRVYPNYEVGSDKAILKKMKELLIHKNPSWPLSEIKKEVRKEFQNNIERIHNPKLMVERMNSMIDNFFGIASFSETNKNLLMWSHYSDSHQGFCVEYDAHRIYDITVNYLNKLDKLIVFHKIIYEPGYPIIDPYITSFDTKEFLKMITIKSDIWSYEIEWRLVYYKFPDVSLDFPDDIIKSIYFGVNCTEKMIEECKNLISTKKKIPILYKAKLLHRIYGIDYDIIN
jgi:hypothetical protein